MHHVDRYLFISAQDNPCEFLSVWESKELTWCCWSGVLISDVSGICLAIAIYLVFSGWFVGSSDVSQEFRRLTLHWHSSRWGYIANTRRVRYCPTVT
jgi:hypothetical protein